MKALNLLLPATCLLFNVILVQAQSKHPPTQVDQAFAKMFPQAQNIDWKDMSEHYTVYFSLAGKKCEAKFALSGDWLSTQMPISLDSLPRPLIDSFKICPYSDWTTTSAYVFRFANQPIQYHLIITKADQGRKILYFRPEGQLLAIH